MIVEFVDSEMLTFCGIGRSIIIIIKEVHESDSKHCRKKYYGNLLRDGTKSVDSGVT